MEPRLDAYKRVPGTLPAIRGLENLVRESGLEAPLLELVRIRASQMNGCAYCLDIHSKDARAAGETEQRLDPCGRCVGSVRVLNRPNSASLR